MDIRLVKQWREKYWDTDDEMNLGELPVIDWLIEQVERLGKQSSEYFSQLVDEQEKAAKRCAAIADNCKYNISESPSAYETACLDIYDAICEEFQL